MGLARHAGGGSLLPAGIPGPQNPAGGPGGGQGLLRGQGFLPSPLPSVQGTSRRSIAQTAARGSGDGIWKGHSFIPSFVHLQLFVVHLSPARQPTSF